MKIDAVAKTIISPQPRATKPAELSVSESMKTQENAMEQGSENLQDAVSLGQTAESALDSVNSSLQRVRALSLQAQNGTYSQSDKAVVQTEIDQLLSGIEENLKNTEFNTIKLFDGGFEGNIQSGGEGQGRMMKIENTSLESLGLDNYDITKGSSLENIDNAIEKVTQTRGDIGSQVNAYESAVRSNDVARENTLASRNRFDEDFAKQVSELKRLQITQQYKYQLQKKSAENDKSQLNLLT